MSVTLVRHNEYAVITALRAVVAAKGESYTYERLTTDGFVCQYWDREKGCPSCLVGHVLAHLGHPEVPRAFEGAGLLGIVEGNETGEFARYFKDRFTMRAIRLLNRAQRYQDDGFTWGYALKATEDLYKTMYVRAVLSDVLSEDVE